MSEFASIIDLASLDGITGFRMDGIDVNDYSGFRVSSAGDINGDGFDDILIGANGADPGGDRYAGESYVVFGKVSGIGPVVELADLDGATGFRLDGINAYDVACRVSKAGDVNGDGFDDVLIGSNRNQSYVVFGKSSGFGSEINLASLNGSNGFRLDGIDAGDLSGYSVCSAGDVNGDSVDDMLIGAPRGDPGGHVDAGEIYVVFGKTSGFASAIDLASLNGTTGFRLDGIDQGDHSGVSVASAGDVNGDGFDDIAIGATHADPGGDTDAGESYVVFGKASGFTSLIDLASLNGSTGFRLDGIDVSDYSGSSVASAGDFNGDGFDDILIGVSKGDPGGDTDAGEAYIVFGRASGFASVIDLASLNGSTGFRLDGIDRGDGSGRSVSSAGDVNGDGFEDILIGASDADPGGDYNAGESYVMFGRASGFASAIDLASLDGSTGFRLEGIDPGDFSGRSASSAGDVNGDGFGDILIGAYGGGGVSDAGESYVIFGRPPDAAVNRVGAEASQYINGGAFADTLSGLGGDDRLEGRAGADGLNGGGGTDTASYQHASAGVAVNLGNLAGSTGDAAGDSYVSIELFRLSGQADWFLGTAGFNACSGLAGADTVSGGGGNDLLAGGGGKDLLAGGTGADTLNGGSGADAASYAGDSSVTVDLSNSANNTGAAAGDVFIGIESIAGSNFDADSLTGDGGTNAFWGHAGDDSLSGGGGNDTLVGGAGADSLDGGDGSDSANYSAEVAVIVDLAANGNSAGDTLTSIENVTGSKSGGDRLTGNSGGNWLGGLGGADALAGGGASDTLSGGTGGDSLSGGVGNDFLYGDEGADRLDGGAGRDILNGAAGADVFDFNLVSDMGNTDASRDAIADFNQADDFIDLSDAGGFAFVAAFTGAGAAQIRAQAFTGAAAAKVTIVHGDADGDGAADFQIQLQGVFNLTAADFVL